jgi:hypothetical protein
MIAISLRECCTCKLRRDYLVRWLSGLKRRSAKPNFVSSNLTLTSVPIYFQEQSKIPNLKDKPKI